MSEQAGTTTETTAKAESPYWIGRHKRGFLGSMALIGITATGFFTWIGVNRSEDIAASGKEALRQDRACVRIIDDIAGPKADTATVRLDSLTAQQQADCRVDDLPSNVNVSRTPGYGPQLQATIVKPTVTLPSRQSLMAAEASDLKDSQTSKWDDLPFDLGMGLVGLPLTGFIVTAAISGDAFTYNHRPTTPHREQTTISA